MWGDLARQRGPTADAKECGQAGDLEVLSTRESVLKRPDMWIGDVTTVTKLAWEVIEVADGANETEIEGHEADGESASPAPHGTDLQTNDPLRTPTKSPLRPHSRKSSQK